MKILNVLLFAVIALILIPGHAFAENLLVPRTIEGTVRVSAEELIVLVESTPNLVILDARKKSDYRKGFIEGAISLPNTETNAKRLAKYIKNKNSPILFYCNGVKCGRSVKAAHIAIEEGYNKIYWFRGGMEEWEAKGLPVISLR